MSKKDIIISLPNPHLREKSQRVQALSPQIQQVIEDMKAATLDWEASRPHEVGVALAAIQIDRAYRVIVVRENLEDKADQRFKVLINPKVVKLEGEIKEELPVSAGLAGENKERLQVGEDGPVPSVYPSICPKLMTIPKIVPPQQDLKWIEAFQSFDAAASKLESVKLHEYLTKFNGTIPSDPKDRDEYFAKLNDYFIKR